MAIGVERLVLVGHSFGALVALALAEQFPGAVSRLILLAPIAFPEWRPLEHSLFAPRSMPFLGPSLAAAAAPLDRPMLEMVHAVEFWPDRPAPRWKQTYPWDEILAPRAGVSNGEDAAAIHPLSAAGWIDVGKVTAPTDIICGRSDLIVGHARQAEPLSRLLGDARYWLVGRRGI